MKEAINDIVSETGYTIIVDENVSGIITAEIKRRSIRSILDIISSIGPFDYKMSNGFIHFGLAEKESSTWTSITKTYVYRLKNISAEEIQKMFPSEYTPFYKIDKKNNRIILSANRKRLNTMFEALTQFDLRPNEIVLDLILTEMSSNAKKEIGTSLSDLNASQLIKNFTGSYTQILETFKFFQETGEMKVIAGPQIRIQEGSKASFRSLKKDYVLLTNNNLNRIDEVEAGIKVDLTPSILKKNEIQLDIHDLTVGMFMDEYSKRIHEHKLSTKVKIKNGNTVMIGGLISKRKNKTITAIPILGNLPLIGNFFKKEKSITSNQEIVFLVRPRLVCK